MAKMVGTSTLWQTSTVGHCSGISTCMSYGYGRKVANPINSNTSIEYFKQLQNPQDLVFIVFMMCFFVWSHSRPSDVGTNKVLISFEDDIKGFQMWKGGPWNVRGYILNMHPWHRNKSALEVDHKRMELWIQIHGVPRNCMNHKNAKKLGAAL
ncbi:hypothetical protein PIB30_101855 [Stylosanthes scabra]|uniref:DUF4283 domain-containing protein n=1 Tax=Stylosanthes scabra TaxID=79078 RepID=A0ABU6XWN6_9FABA|nr:hypothetical protein [Stylosanthes scabra]